MWWKFPWNKPNNSIKNDNNILIIISLPHHLPSTVKTLPIESISSKMIANSLKIPYQFPSYFLASKLAAFD